MLKIECCLLWRFVRAAVYCSWLDICDAVRGRRHYWIVQSVYYCWREYRGLAAVARRLGPEKFNSKL